MSEVIVKLRNVAKQNFCEKCYSNYLTLIQPEIEHLLSEPIADWKQAELNIDMMWIKANGYCKKSDSTTFSPLNSGLKKARHKATCKKLKFLNEKETIGNYLFNFLNIVRKRRNNIHPPDTFSKQDYVMFREAKTLTDLMSVIVVHELNDQIWNNTKCNIEKRAKLLIEKFQLT